MNNSQPFSPPLASPKLHQKIANNTPILGGAIIVVILLFVGGWLCFCFRRKLCATFKSYGNNKEKLNAGKMKLKHFTLEDLQRATDNFNQERLVGSGAFGNVYCGTFHLEGTLAIKKPHADQYTSTEDFRNEVRLLSKVKHNNLVRLVGFCEETGPKGAKVLVYEYVTNGSLLDYIIGRGRRSLTWRERVNIAIGAAKGIAHLHEAIDPSIIHRDIKPSNILIGEGFEAKVSDFGLVRSGPVGDQSHVSSLIKGTPGYLDPAYCASYHLTPFTDVYSFGVILLQLVAARPAVESSRSSTISHIINWARPSIEKGCIEEIIDTNLLLEECNMEMMLKIGQLALRCVVQVPRKRPTMSQVWQELEANLYWIDNLTLKQPVLMDSRRYTGRSIQSVNRVTNQSLASNYDDYSQSIVSIDGIGLQRFQVDMDDSVSFRSASLRCLEMSIDDDFSIPR